jgi:hypothetical protein
MNRPEIYFRVSIMKTNVNLLDTVALLDDVREGELLLRRGEVGDVVEELAPDVYEVEFCDNHGRAYAFASLKAEQLLVLHYGNPKADSDSGYFLRKAA